jgi:hypothetical protein
VSINTIEKSHLTYILNWLLGDIFKTLNLIVRVAKSMNDDLQLRREVATSLWSVALYKLSKFTDYIVCLSNIKQTKDRKRCIKRFNLENNTVIPDCSIKKIHTINFLRKVRDEIIHGASGDLHIPPLKYVGIIDDIAYVHCRILKSNEDCNLCDGLKCIRDNEELDIIRCKVSINDIISSLTATLNIWAEQYKIELEKVVTERRNSHIRPTDKKPNDYIPWWFEPNDELFAYSL